MVSWFLLGDCGIYNIAGKGTVGVNCILQAVGGQNGKKLINCILLTFFFSSQDTDNLNLATFTDIHIDACFHFLHFLVYSEWSPLYIRIRFWQVNFVCTCSLLLVAYLYWELNLYSSIIWTFLCYVCITFLLLVSHFFQEDWPFSEFFY